MSDRKAKGKPARVRVPAMFDALALIHWKMTRQHHPGDAVMLQLQDIVEAIMQTTDPRHLHKAIRAALDLPTRRGRPHKGNASEAALDFVVDRYLKDEWSLYRCRKLLNLERTEFENLVADVVEKRNARLRIALQGRQPHDR